MRRKDQQALYAQGLKKCCACGRILPCDNFANPNGWGKCRECQREYDRTVRRKRYRAMVLEGGSRIAKKRAYMKKYYIEHKEAILAYWKAYRERKKAAIDGSDMNENINQ